MKFATESLGLHVDNSNYNNEMEYHVLTEKTIKKATQMRGFFCRLSTTKPENGRHGIAGSTHLR
jgi:hypothetical protein